MNFKILGNYQRTKISKGLALLYSNRTMGAVAKSLLALFLPVFFYTKFDLSISNVILLYIFNFVLMYLLVIPGARLMNRLGLRRSIILSAPFSAFYYISLYFLDLNIVWMAILAFTFLNIARALYWTPYHTSFAKFSQSGSRGRQVSLLTTMSDIIQIFVPLVSSFLIVSFGFQYLFVLVLFIELMAVIPVLYLPVVNEKFTWSYKETYKQLFSKKHRDILWSYYGDGVQLIVGMVFWPIFIWLLFDESFKAVGFITAAIIFVSMILRLIIGDYIDKYQKKKMLRAGTLLYAVGWVLKIFVATTFQVFIISAYHNLAAIIMRTPFDAGMYDQAADWGHYADEYTVIREMALSLGRVTALCVMFVLVYFLPLSTAFVVAAVGSLLINTTKYTEAT